MVGYAEHGKANFGWLLCADLGGCYGIIWQMCILLLLFLKSVYNTVWVCFIIFEKDIPLIETTVHRKASRVIASAVVR